MSLERIEGEGVYIQVRGTEPRLTNVTIDGITIPSPEPTVRQIRLDVIPADLVESVEINKTLAPNIDGDGIGGSVNMKTKTGGRISHAESFRNRRLRPHPGRTRQLTSSAAPSGHRFGKEEASSACFSAAPTITMGAASITFSPPSTRSPPSPSRSTTTTPSANTAITATAGDSPATPITNSDDSPAFTSRAFTPIFRTTAINGITRPCHGGAKFYTSSKRPDASISSYLIWAAANSSRRRYFPGKSRRPSPTSWIRLATRKPIFPGSDRS